jgi:hypothetical protein
MKTYINKDFNTVVEQLKASSSASFEFKVYFEDSTGQSTRIGGCTEIDENFFIRTWDTRTRIQVSENDKIYIEDST